MHSMVDPLPPLDFSTVHLPADPDEVAPDGSDVRILLSLPGRGSLAHFQLAEGATSTAVRHRRVEEIWYFLSGHGEMWRRNATREETVAVGPGDCLTVPLGTTFQFRSRGPGPLEAVGVTMPPWPGPDEAVLVDGAWAPTTGPGHG
jgi:mannose-6-phosphate isomerase-like protein (cupin superfamily)